MWVYELRSWADDVETIPIDEVADIQKVVPALKSILARSHAKSGAFRADVHVRTHGYARGEFRVLPNLPDELARGLFEHDGVHPAVVRFSNSSSQLQPDAIPDGRGMAIKVLNVNGEMISADEQRSRSRDFLMINHPIFFVRNVKDYLRLEQVLVQANDSALAALEGTLTGGDWNPLHWHCREMLTAARIAGHFPAHPASNTYFSMAPIRFGRYVAKYRVKPIGEHFDSYLSLIAGLTSQTDVLQPALEETLRTQEVLFEFQIRLQTSGRTMPVEDASVECPESESPFRTVGHLLRPRQEIDRLRYQNDFRNLAFNVWHALAAHRPLGGINRVRRAVYGGILGVASDSLSAESELQKTPVFSNASWRDLTVRHITRCRFDQPIRPG